MILKHAGFPLRVWILRVSSYNQNLRVVRNPFYHHQRRLLQTFWVIEIGFKAPLNFLNYNPDVEGKKKYLSIASQYIRFLKLSGQKHILFLFVSLSISQVDLDLGNSPSSYAPFIFPSAHCCKTTYYHPTQWQDPNDTLPGSI